MAGEEERQPRAEVVEGQVRRLRRLDVGDCVGDREADFLRGGAAGLAHVVSGDRNRVPARHFAGAVVERIGDQPHRGLGRVDVRPPRDVLLENVVLDRTADLALVDALLFGDRRIEREQRRRGGVDRHRGSDPIQRDAVEQRAHILDRVDRHANLADLALGHRGIGVVTDLRGQIKRD